MTTDNQKKYEEAAKEYSCEEDRQFHWLNGAYFAEKENESRIKELISETHNLGERLIDAEEHGTYKEQQIERLAEIEVVIKTAHNAAIDKALTAMKIEWREDRHEIYNAIAKLKL